MNSLNYPNIYWKAHFTKGNFLNKLYYSYTSYFQGLYKFTELKRRSMMFFHILNKLFTILAAGCKTCICFKIVAPSLVIVTSPFPLWIYKNNCSKAIKYNTSANCIHTGVENYEHSLLTCTCYIFFSQNREDAWVFYTRLFYHHHFIIILFK